jgi:hypothetical protein
MENIFRTKDGKEFDNKEDAKQHEEFIERKSKIDSNEKLYTIFTFSKFQESGYATQYSHSTFPIITHTELLTTWLPLWKVHESNNYEILNIDIDSINLYDSLIDVYRANYEYSYYYWDTIVRIR